METHSSILAWRVPRTEEPGGLQSMASQIVKHNRACMHCFHFVFWFLGPEARGISAPQKGINLRPLRWKLTSRPLDQEGIPLLVFLFCSYYWTKNRL